MVPINYILLLIFTLSLSYIVMFAVSECDPKSVLAAALVTTGTAIGLTAIAFNTEVELELKDTIIPLSFISAFICIFVSLALHSSPLAILISFMIALLYGIYLVLDLQLILGHG